jgi:hypothetical protein
MPRRPPPRLAAERRRREPGVGGSAWMRRWESISSKEALLEASQREHGRVLVIVDPCHTPRLPVVLDPLTLQYGTGCDEGAASGERAATRKHDAVADCHRRNLPPPQPGAEACDQVHRPRIRTQGSPARARLPPSTTRPVSENHSVYCQPIPSSVSSRLVTDKELIKRRLFWLARRFVFRICLAQRSRKGKAQRSGSPTRTPVRVCAS